MYSDNVKSACVRIILAAYSFGEPGFDLCVSIETVTYGENDNSGLEGYE